MVILEFHKFKINSLSKKTNELLFTSYFLTFGIGVRNPKLCTGVNNRFQWNRRRIRVHACALYLHIFIKTYFARTNNASAYASVYQYSQDVRYRLFMMYSFYISRPLFLPIKPARAYRNIYFECIFVFILTARSKQIYCALER